MITIHNDDSKTIVVLGSLRSGTSMTASILQSLGVDMGEDALDKSRANPFGYYEDKSFFKLNHSILEAAGGDEHSPPTPDSILNQRDRFADTITNIVTERVNECRGNLWGWKHPATSLTIGLIIDFIPNPHIIVCRRDCESVARSLSKMVDLSYNEARRLCLEYNRRIDNFIKTHGNIPILELEYEQAHEKPKEYVESIISLLNISPSVSQKTSAVNRISDKYKVRINQIKLLIIKAIDNPSLIPSYLIKRIRFVLDDLIK